MAKTINVKGCVHAVDGGKRVALRAASNPHEVGDALAKELIEAGLASGVAGRPAKAQTTKADTKADTKAGE
jgi:topoisomerase IA-like protein